MVTIVKTESQSDDILPHRTCGTIIEGGPDQHSRFKFPRSSSPRDVVRLTTTSQDQMIDARLFLRLFCVALLPMCLIATTHLYGYCHPAERTTMEPRAKLIQPASAARASLVRKTLPSSRSDIPQTFAHVRKTWQVYQIGTFLVRIPSFALIQEIYL